MTKNTEKSEKTIQKTPILTGNSGKISSEAENLTVQKKKSKTTQEPRVALKIPENANVEANFSNMPQKRSNIPQMAVDILLAAIEDGEVNYVEPEHVVIDSPPNHNWNGKSYILLSEDISTGSPHQHGIGPVKTPLLMWAETRALADQLCKEATRAVLTGFSRLARKGLGIHGAIVDAARVEGKKMAKSHGGSRNENEAGRFIIVINSVNSI